MKKVDCIAAEELIMAKVDEGLEPSANTTLEEHLQACPQCRRFEQETTSVVRLMASDLPEEPDAEFWKYYDISLKARLQDAKPRFSWNWWWKMAAAAAVAVAAFAVVHVQMSDSPLKPDATVAPALAQVLEQVYGPVEDENSSADLIEADKSALAALSIPYPQEEVVQWFEVEDENSLFL
jgi:anti-sigma factor RsiW